MAHMHFKRTVYKAGGRAAVGRVAYITRQPVEALDRAVQQLRYIGNDAREDLLYANHRNLPAFSGDRPHTYFAAAEKYERYKGVAFEEWKISLPVELYHRQNMDVMRDLVNAIAGDTLPISYAFHAPRTLDDQHEQPHLHFILSARENDGIERTAAQHFRRYNPDSPGSGGARKAPSMNHMGAVKQHRILIADVLNVHLEQAGLAARVHPDSLKERQLQRQPEPKLRPYESRQYREDGTISPRMQKVLDIRAERTQQMAREQNNAHTYWEGRKAALGLTRDMPREQKLERLRNERTQAITHKPARQERTLEQTRAPQQERTQERRRELTHERSEPSIRERLAALGQQLTRWERGAGLGDEAHGAGLRVHLHDEERDRGMSW